MNALVDRLELAGHRRSAAAESSGGHWPSAPDWQAVLAVLRADYPAATEPAAEPAGPLVRVGEVFGLDDTDSAILWLAAAADLDATVGQAYALLRGLTGSARPTVALALELVAVATATAEPFCRLGANAPLRVGRLLEMSDSEQWLSRVLWTPDAVTAVLAGAPPADPVVSRIRVPAVPVSQAATPALTRAIEQGVPLIWVRSHAGAAGTSLAASAFAALELPFLAVDVRRRLAGQPLLEVVWAATREAGLRGWGLIVVGAEALADPMDRGALEALERAVVPVIAVGSRPWNPSWLTQHPFVVDSEPLTVADRAQLWRAALGELAQTDDELRETLLGLRFTPEDVFEVARHARVTAAAQGAQLSAKLVRAAARRIGGSGSSSAEQVAVAPAAGSGPSFDDLVLPPRATNSLRQLVNWARHRDEVAAQGPLRGRGRGIAALFTGNPGTGKTLAAHVIAEELSIDLFQVDLSAVVDKYIGETEKNLEKVFQAAEALDVVLFFDEADALFGSRSQVHDARDRYANQEVAYLLQRIEHFDGITILATNLRGNLDRAFSRRMSFIVHFPDPDAATRRELWQHHLAQLPTLDETDPVQLDFLAEAVEVAGGDIRNIVLAAAYDAVSAGQLLGMRHVVAAAASEYRKLGRVIPEHGFVPVSPSV
jgi:hypothetical protein